MSILANSLNENNAYRFPVSVKGIVSYGDKVLLLKNERNEWELPGGKLELHESPELCVEREILEESGLSIVPLKIIDIWVYTIIKDVKVLIVTYGCSSPETDQIIISNEHKKGAWFSLSEIEDLNMPAGYKNSIKLWLNK